MSKPAMHPAPGERLVKFVGDRCTFQLRPAPQDARPSPLQAFLRTNIGRGRMLRQEIVNAAAQPRNPAGASWHDIEMRWQGDRWELDLALTEVGFFRAKPYLKDERGWQTWPEGDDVGISVHPNHARTANTIYCAFTRMFGPTRDAASTEDPRNEELLVSLDQRGFTVIPPSGTFRDLIGCLPHILDTLGCRILHLLPIHPTPTTYARMGRFGSPYAALDLTAIDPALAEFDRRTTAVDQFQELCQAVHQRGARLFLDMVINHTGWGSVLQNTHPDWFARDPDGCFKSPGAWGNTWADLVELEPDHPKLWETFAEAFLTWCRRGVDGFRCDAGYKVPMPVWQYITARVHQEYPDTLFLLEGLGGSWDDTANLLTEGGMQWAYSELFQEFNGAQVAGYLKHALRESRRVGTLVHYSETHDNTRLASRGKTWSRLRNQLSALTSVHGAFGFTCGVEWLAPERVNVHSSRGLAWNNTDNLVEDLRRLNHLLANHPSFFDGAVLTRVSAADAPVCALLRESADGTQNVLVLANTDPDKPHTWPFRAQELPPDKVATLKQLLQRPLIDLLGNPSRALHYDAHRRVFSLSPGQCCCLCSETDPAGSHGDDYRRRRAQVAWAFQAANHVLRPEDIGPCSWKELAAWVATDPIRYLNALSRIRPEEAKADFLRGLEDIPISDCYPEVIGWKSADASRICLVPAGHWLVVQSQHPFRSRLEFLTTSYTRESTPVNGGHIAAFPPDSRLHAAGGSSSQESVEAQLSVEEYGAKTSTTVGTLRFLPPVAPDLPSMVRPGQNDLVLLTNQRGGMARIPVDLGHIQSKYDCVLGANLHPDTPVDRHVLVKRIRIWTNVEGFISPLHWHNLESLRQGPPACWSFLAHGGDGRHVAIRVSASMIPGKNALHIHVERGPGLASTKPAHTPHTEPGPHQDWEVRLTLRFDLEDRGFHGETKRNAGAEHHFHSHSRALSHHVGFEFTPAPDRRLAVISSAGHYHHQPEWSDNIQHPIEQARGQVGSGDAFSPGWFDIPLSPHTQAEILVSVEPEASSSILSAPHHAAETAASESRSFESTLSNALDQFVVRRGKGRTVIAGYPWFLDWGRDTFIVARGLIAAGRHADVLEMLQTFGRFEHRGTLPNTIFGNDASNRDTSDAPLLYALVCDELDRTGFVDSRLCDTPVEVGGRTIGQVLQSIAHHYWQGTPNGIHADLESGLVWSPSHFTWMDTNHPAGTPREGYPIEIQALWIRCLHLLHRWEVPNPGLPWNSLADKAQHSLEELYWLPAHGYLSDVLFAPRGTPARTAIQDTALRSNNLFAISLGLIQPDRARLCVQAAQTHLVVPGALRSLAPLTVSPPLPIRSPDGRLLNDPDHPYWGTYQGDEDSQRKPAYHNGTAWVWTFPLFCESLARAWDFSPEALQAARSYLASLSDLLLKGCLGHLPEIVDGDAPHTARGCDAQAWSVSEALRVWKFLQTGPKA